MLELMFKLRQEDSRPQIWVSIQWQNSDILDGGDQGKRRGELGEQISKGPADHSATGSCLSIILHSGPGQPWPRIPTSAFRVPLQE